jgi:eukaryotic-like serine/threonine-protein kinase
MQPSLVCLNVLEGTLKGREFAFGRPGCCLVGRAHDCDLRLSENNGEMAVSRHHCLFEFNPPQIQVRDLGSLNGTYVNGVKIGQRLPGSSAERAEFDPSPPCELRDGDEIQMGHTVFQVHLHTATETSRPEPAADQVVYEVRSQ